MRYLSAMLATGLLVYLTRVLCYLNAAVVWNPWQKGLAMADLGEEYVNMLCVEAGHVSDRIQLAAGSQFQASQVLTVIG